MLKQDLDQVLFSIDWTDQLKDSVYEALDIALHLQLQEHLPDEDNDDLGSSGCHLTVSDDSSMDSFTCLYHQLGIKMTHCLNFSIFVQMIFMMLLSTLL